MQTRRRLLAASLPIFVAGGGRDAAAGPAVAGAEIRLNGVPLRLRGVAVGDPMLARSGRSTADYAFLARIWRAGVVRLSVHPSTFRENAQRALEALERDVSAALAAGLKVIVDWHAIGWPDGAAFEGESSWGLPAGAFDTSVALARAFWDAAAPRFAGRDVIFEVWNEPVLLAESGRLRPPGADWAALKPLWVELTERIRRSADNMILATGGSWAADLTGVRSDLLPDPNTGYAWHVYPEAGGGDPAGWERLLDDLDRVRPVVVTEWGFSERPGLHQGTAEGFGRTFAEEFLVRRGLHWTAWCWHPSWHPPLIGRDWRTPTPFGRFVRDLLDAG